MLDWHGAAFKSLNTHGKEYNTHNLSLFCRSTGYLNFPYLCPLYYFSLCIIDEKQKTQFFFFFLLIDCLVNRDIHCGYHLSTGQLTCHSRPILCSTLAVPSVPVDWNTHTWIVLWSLSAALDCFVWTISSSTPAQMDIKRTRGRTSVVQSEIDWSWLSSSCNRLQHLHNGESDQKEPLLYQPHDTLIMWWPTQRTRSCSY